MSKNSEILKIIEDLNFDELKVVEESMAIINKIENAFLAVEGVASEHDNKDIKGYDPNTDSHFTKIALLISSLRTNLTTFLQNLKLITYSYDKSDASIKLLSDSQQQVMVGIWELINEMPNYFEEDNDYKDITEDDDFEDPANLLELLKKQLVALDGNYIILVKLYNKNILTEELLTYHSSFNTSGLEIEELPIMLKLRNLEINLD